MEAKSCDTYSDHLGHYSTRGFEDFPNYKFCHYGTFAIEGIVFVCSFGFIELKCYVTTPDYDRIKFIIRLYEKKEGSDSAKEITALKEKFGSLEKALGEVKRVPQESDLKAENAALKAENTALKEILRSLEKYAPPHTNDLQTNIQPGEMSG